LLTHYNQLGYSEYTNCTLSVVRQDGKGEDWPSAFICWGWERKGANASNTWLPQGFRDCSSSNTRCCHKQVIMLTQCHKMHCV